MFVNRLSFLSILGVLGFWGVEESHVIWEKLLLP
jgi:hypothetical protein